MKPMFSLRKILSLVPLTIATQTALSPLSARAGQYKEAWPPTDEPAAVCRHYYDANVLCQKRIAAACRERDGSATQLKRFGINPRKCLKPLPYRSKDRTISEQRPENSDPLAEIDPGNLSIPGQPILDLGIIDLGPDPVPGSPPAMETRSSPYLLRVGAWKITHSKLGDDAACLMVGGDATENNVVHFLETKNRRVLGISTIDYARSETTERIIVKAINKNLTFRSEGVKDVLHCKSALCHTAFTELDVKQWNLLMKMLTASGQPPELVEAMRATFKTDFANFVLSTNGFPAALHGFIRCVRKLS